MTEEEIIRKYKEKKAEEAMVARHSLAAQKEDPHREHLHSTHSTPTQQEAEEPKLLNLGTSDLQEARLEQYKRGNTSFVGGTGDSMLVDDSGNFVETPSPFDTASTSTTYDYATDKEKAKEVVENKLPTSNLISDYESAKLALDADLAWSNYLETGTIAAKRKAENASKEYEDYMEKNGYMVGNAPYLSENAAYLPQAGYYLQSNIPAGVLSGLTFAGTTAVTKNTTAGGVAAKVMYDVASLGTSYDATRKMTEGALFKQLLDMGVPEGNAKYYAQESARQQAATEIASEGIQNVVEWALAAVSSGTMPVKVAKAILASRGFDVASESVEEFIQEGQSISAEKSALKASGLDASQYTPEYESQRKWEAAAGAVPISLGVGMAEGAITQGITTTVVDKRNVNSIKQGYNNAIKNLQQENTELQTKLENTTLSGKEKYTIEKQIKDNNKQITYLQEQSSQENVESAYKEWKKFQEALKESKELRDSTQLVETKYVGDIENTLKTAEERAQKQFGNGDIKIEAETTITQTEKNLKDLVERKTGKEVVFYSVFGLDNLGNIRGFVEDGNTIYIESGQNAKDMVAAAAHEIGHIIAKDNSVLFNTFVDKVKAKYGDSLYNKIVDYNNQTGTYDLQGNETLTTKQQDYLSEEMFGDYLAEIASKGKNVKAFENSSLNVFDKLKDFAKNVASEALGLETQNNRISGYDYSGISYANGDILEDSDFEQQVMDAFKSLKKQDKVAGTFTDKPEGTTKSIFKLASVNSPREAQENDVYDRIEQRYRDMKGKESPVAIKQMIANELGKEYNALNEDREVKRIYADLKDNGEITRTGVKLSARKSSKKPTPKKQTETGKNRVLPKPAAQEDIINNQLNKIAEQQEKIEELEAENKGLRNINKGIKSTGRQQIKNVQSESNKMLKTGRKQELKMRGQLERAGKKYNRLSEAAADLKLERELERTARKDGINFPREYKNLYIGLRRTGDSVKEAYATTRSIFDESQAVNKSIGNSIDILRELRKSKVYNKLPNDIKAKINEYANIWVGSKNQSDLTLAKRVLTSLTARELRENGVNLTKAVRNQIMSEEGYGWENGKGSKSLQELFNGSKEVAQAFEQELIKLRQEVADFQARNFLEERTKQLHDAIITMQDEVSSEIGKQKKEFKRNVLKSNNTTFNTLMTLKTEIQALMGGNGNTEMMLLNDNLQKGEIRKKQAIVEIYKILSEFMRRSKGLNYALNTQRWSPTLEKSLSNKSKFVDTGMTAYDSNGHEVNIKIPRSMMMSLAMHLQNEDNMSHISGAATRLTTDNSGNTHITYGKGQGIRIPNEELFRAGKEKEAYDSGVTVRLLEEQVEGIANMLTEEEKAFVKATSEVFKYTSELINEVSNRIVGYDLATVENYFPIRVWDRIRRMNEEITSPTLKQRQETYGDALGYMLNPGWLQERATSFNPIYLENIAEVLNRVVNNVSNFYGYAEALRDNNILLHSTMPNGTSFNKSIDDLSSSFMTNYNRLARFITGQESLRDGKFRGLMAMNTLTFNIGTWLTQPMSFFNTIKYFSGKEFLSGINPINNNIKLNKMIRDYFDEIGIDHAEYNDYQVARAFIAMATPNLDSRAIGYKIPKLDQLFSKGLADKIGAHGIEALDNVAVTAIARMMAYSVSLDPNIKFGSEEYFDVLGERLTPVLVETQPEFSQVNRANMFRSSNPILRMLSLFGTPANQMINNFAQSALQLKYEAREGNVQKKTVAGLIKSASGIALSSALVGLVRALRDSIRAGDDDDTEFTEKWIAQSIIAILGPTLILDDVAQFVMGQTKYGGISSYDFNTPETTFVNGIKTLGEKVLQLGDGEISPAKKTRDIIRALGVITPIDTKSMVRIVEALMKFMSPDLYGTYQLQTNSTVYKQWLKNSGSDMATFYKAYTATREKNLTNKYGYRKADKSKNIKSNLKEAREKALKDVLKNQKEVDKYMEILFGYKK